jgi:hypothetical protein
MYQSAAGVLFNLELSPSLIESSKVNVLSSCCSNQYFLFLTKKALKKALATIRI